MTIYSSPFCRNHECDKCSESGSCSGASGKRSSTLSDDLIDGQSKCSSIATIYNGHSSVRNAGRSVSTAIIYPRGNLQQNLNKAFEGSELSLQGTLERPKKQKRTHWQDEVETQRETAIQIERYWGQDEINARKAIVLLCQGNGRKWKVQFYFVIL